MLRERVSPALRERGFSGGGGKFYLRGPTGHVGSILMSGNWKRSTAELFDYHVHVGVTSLYLRQTEEFRGEPIRSRPADWADHDWLDEIGEYQLRATDDIDDHADHLLEELDRAAIPRILPSLTDEGLRAAVDACPVGVGRGWARLLLDIAQGNLETARRDLAQAARDRGEDDPLVVGLRHRLEEAESRP